MVKKCAGIKTGCLVLLVVQLLFIAGVGNLRAKESPEKKCQEKKYPELEYPRGILKMLGSTATTNLLNELGKDKWNDQLLKEYFGDGGYDPELANFVIYINSTGVLRKYDLLWKGKKTEHLFGAKNIYVLIFSEIKLDTPEDSSKDTFFVARWTALNYPREPGELGLLSSIGQLFSLPAPESKEEVLKSEEKKVLLERISISSEHSKTLYAGMVRFTLESKTKNRITLFTSKEKDTLQISVYDVNSDTLVPMRSLFFNFGNYSNSRLAGSIGLVNTGRAYLLGHIYVSRPLTPHPSGGKFLNKVSISLFAGTTISEKDRIFKDNIVGLSMGNVVGYWGVIFGYPVEEIKSKSLNYKKIVFGINYMF